MSKNQEQVSSERVEVEGDGMASQIKTEEGKMKI